MEVSVVLGWLLPSCELPTGSARRSGSLGWTRWCSGGTVRPGPCDVVLISTVQRSNDECRSKFRFTHQVKWRLTQVHYAHLRGCDHAPQRPQLRRFFPTTVTLCPVSTAVIAVLPCGVGEGNPALFASDYRWVCEKGMGRHDCPC